MAENRRPNGPSWAAMGLASLAVLSALLAIDVAMGRQPEGGGRWLRWDFLFGSRPPSLERNAPASLKTVATAEADFRANNRDGSGTQEFWRADVAGLFTTIPKGGSMTDAIKLIEISVAAADDRPVSDITKYARRSPKSGYWFRAIRKKGEPPVNAAWQFAFCAFPDTPSAGRWTYIIDEGNTIYKADLGATRGIEVFPSDEELRARWSKMD